MHTTNIPAKKPLIVWVLLVLLALTWGSSFILMKKGLEFFTPQQVVALRILIGALALLPFTTRVPLADRQGSRLPYILFIALIGNLLPGLCFTFAETRISSSLAGILNCLTPIFTVLMGFALFRTPIRWVQGVGLLLGFAGAATIIWLQPNVEGTANYGYAGLVLLAGVCYSISANTVKSRLAGIAPMSIASIGLPMLAPFMALYLWHTGLMTLVMHNPAAQHAMGYMLVLGALGTGFANFVYYYLIQRTSPLFASIVTYLMPIVAVGWGILAHETLGLVHLAGMCLILLGVWLTSK